MGQPQRRRAEFLTQNNVDKVYLRFFDIRDDFRFGPVPDAEVGTDRTDFPDGTEIVPCVFITLEAIEGMSGREKEFAMKIFERIDAKCKNGDLSFDGSNLTATGQNIHATPFSLFAKS